MYMVRRRRKVARFLLAICILSSAFSASAFADSSAYYLHVFDSVLKFNPKQAYTILQNLNARANTPVLNAYSRLYLELGLCDSAMLFSKRGLLQSRSENGRSQSLLLTGSSFRCAGQADSALHYYILAEKSARKCRDSLVLLRTYYYLGHVHSELGKYEKATDYYQTSNNLAIRLNDKEFMARNTLAIASNLADRGMLLKALPLLEQSRKQCRAAGLLKQQAIACNNLGILYKQLNQFNKALEYFKESLDIQTQLNNLYEVATERNNIAMIYILNERYDLALPQLLSAEKTLNELNQNQLLPEIYHNLSLCYAKKENYQQAYVYKETERLFTDSLRNIEILKHTERLQTEFETEKRQLEITNLKQENEVKDLTNRAHVRQRNMLVVLAIALFCVAFLVFFFFRQKMLNARQVNEKNLLIHRQQMEEVMRKSELQSIHTMIETQEKERKRIAEDLHDRVGSMLSAVKLQFGHVKTESDKSREQMNKASHLLDEACEEIRLVSHNLVSGVLSTFGLVPALNDLTKALSESSGLGIELMVHGMNDRLASDIEINVYRILQELFNNTIRHAKASRVDIDINHFGGQLTVMYSDNGLGFDTTKLSKPGIGLKNIYSRAEKLGGSVHIDSGKGNGSTFIITIPTT